MKRKVTTEHTKSAILDLQGATCTSCSIAIEHIGRRLDGISAIRVDRARSEIYINYNGDHAVLDKLCDFVRHIGYDATVRDADSEVSIT